MCWVFCGCFCVLVFLWSSSQQVNMGSFWLRTNLYEYGPTLGMQIFSVLVPIIPVSKFAKWAWRRDPKTHLETIKIKRTHTFELGHILSVKGRRHGETYIFTFPPSVSKSQFPLATCPVCGCDPIMLLTRLKHFSYSKWIILIRLSTCESGLQWNLFP